MDFTVKGLRVEQTITYNDRDNTYEENHEDVLLLENKDKWGNSIKCELHLWTIYGDCYSGWCAASYGHSYLEKVKDFNGYNYTPVKDLNISFSFEKDNIPSELPDMENEIFSTSYDDDDRYYASGSSSVNMELFKETPRLIEERLVWIFRGDSISGKSYLAHLISNGTSKTVYETDENSNLPDSIIADIIVLGNKYSFSIEDITTKLAGNNNKLIIVDFKN